MIRRRAKLTLDIVTADPSWHGLRGWRATLKRALPLIIAQTGKKLPPAHYRITLLLTDDAQQKDLNHQFRGRGKPTNVLSFPQFPPSATPRATDTTGYVFLGDISLAYQYIVNESDQYNKILCHHIIHLVIHGILHILGYDHETSRQAVIMEKLETKILAQLSIPDPYRPDRTTAP